MDSKLQTYIDAYGGKHGALLYIREHLPKFRHYVLPLKIFSWDKKLSYWDKLNYTFGSSEYIMRTSHPYDWNGLVDAMPTHRTTIKEFEETMAICRRHCEGDLFKMYTKHDGLFLYNVDDVTVSLTRYEDCFKKVTVTENPHNRDIYYFDITREGTTVIRMDFAGVYSLENKALHYQGLFDGAYGVPVSKIIELCHGLRATGIFDDTTALQFEIGVSRYGIYLFQVRKFSAFNAVKPFLKKSMWRDTGARVFGVTSIEGIKLDVVKKNYIYITDSLPQPFGYFRESSGGKNNQDLLHLPPRTMKGYFPLGNIALTHNHTRFVQRVLRNGGIALLGSHCSDRIDPEVRQVTVFSDGVSMQMTSLTGETINL